MKSYLRALATASFLLAWFSGTILLGEDHNVEKNQRPASTDAGTDASDADTYLEEHGTKMPSAQMRKIMEWASDLPPVTNVGEAYVGCAVRHHAGPSRFQYDFDACWLSDSPASCAVKCNGAYKVFGHYAPDQKNPGSIQYAIYCRCEGKIHNFKLHPVPKGIPVPKK